MMRIMEYLERPRMPPWLSRLIWVALTLSTAQFLYKLVTIRLKFRKLRAQGIVSPTDLKEEKHTLPDSVADFDDPQHTSQSWDPILYYSDTSPSSAD